MLKAPPPPSINHPKNVCSLITFSGIIYFRSSISEYSIMDSHFDPSKCSEEEIDSLKDKIHRNSVQNNANDCLEWTRSCGKSGYPQMRLGQAFYERFNNIPYNPAHLLYTIQHKITLDKGYEISHLCHNKRCVNYEHLSYEPKAVNAARNQCCHSRVCITHQYHDWGIVYPNCVFQQ